MNDVSNGKSLDENADKNQEFILVSFYWLLTCIPVVTIIPACAALFHTVTKVIRQDGEGVTTDFFPLFAMRCIQGAALRNNGGRKPAVIYLCGFWISNDAARTL
ncbi:MAG: DUF624 domain-containing protein [Ruthenibacterium lactatiformans]